MAVAPAVAPTNRAGVEATVALEFGDELGGAFVGTPPTAGVGCSAKARSIAVVEMLRSRPVIAVHRCQTAAVRFNWGWAGIVRSSHSGSRATRIVSTTNWCSCRFLAELASAAALAASSLGSAARGLSRQMACT